MIQSRLHNSGHLSYRVDSGNFGSRTAEHNRIARLINIRRTINFVANVLLIIFIPPMLPFYWFIGHLIWTVILSQFDRDTVRMIDTWRRRR